MLYKKRIYWLCIVFIATGLTLSSLALYCYTISSRPIIWIRQELKRLKQAGEPLDYHFFLPSVPSHLDGTHLYRKAATQLKAIRKQRKWQRAWQVWMETYRKKDKQPDPITISQILRMSHPAIETFKEALLLPHMPLAEEELKALTTLPLSKGCKEFHASKGLLDEFVYLLLLEAFWRKQHGRLDEAVENIYLIFRLTRHMRDDPSFWGLDWRYRMVPSPADWGLRWILKDDDAASSTYQKLAFELQYANIPKDFVRALQMQRALMCFQFERLFNNPKELRTMLRKVPGGVNLAAYFRSSSALLAENWLFALQQWEKAIAFAQNGPPYDWGALKMWESDVRKRTHATLLFRLGSLQFVWQPYCLAWDFHYFFWRDDVFIHVAYMHAFRQLVQLAVALKWYRCKHGKYPENLQALVPHYLPKVLLDPFDGKPLRYQRLERGFKVWSVGPNFRDDGGVVGRDWWNRHDIVYGMR